MMIRDIEALARATAYFNNRPDVRPYVSHDEIFEAIITLTGMWDGHAMWYNDYAIDGVIERLAQCATARLVANG